MLQRQLSECREALRFANQTCEQFEERVEELEVELRGVKSQCMDRESAVSRKSQLIQQLETRLEAVEQKNLLLEKEIGCLREQRKVGDSITTHCRSRSQSGPSLMVKETASQGELQSQVKELTTKLLDSIYQRGKLQEGLEKLLSENHKLTECLATADSEVGELQSKIMVLENALAEKDSTMLSTTPTKRSVSSTPTHSTRRGRIPSTPTHSTFGLQSLSECFSEDGLPSEAKLDVTGMSLFSEFNSSHAQLQKTFDKLVSECKCPASVPYRLGMGSGYCADAVTKVGASGCDATTGKTSIKSTKKESLTDLFQEVFTTLKQTTLVADKLLERKHTKPPSSHQ